MKESLVFLVIFFSILACNISEDIEDFDPSKLPICTTINSIDSCLEVQKLVFISKFENEKDYRIKSALYRGQLVCIFDYCLACDGTASVINNCCDTIGQLCGECFPTSFQKDFAKNTTQTKQIWP